jgi:hypothetical protein
MVLSCSLDKAGCLRPAVRVAHVERQRGDAFRRAAQGIRGALQRRFIAIHQDQPALGAARQQAGARGPKPGGGARDQGDRVEAIKLHGGGDRPARRGHPPILNARPVEAPALARYIARR